MCPTIGICSAVSLAERWLDGAGIAVNSADQIRSNFKSSRNWGNTPTRPRVRSSANLVGSPPGGTKRDLYPACVSVHANSLRTTVWTFVPHLSASWFQKELGVNVAVKKGSKNSGCGHFRPSSSHGSSEHHPVEKK